MDGSRVAAFLRERLAEDEAIARAASESGAEWKIDGRAHTPYYIEAEVCSVTSGLARDHAAHIARHDPLRVLAEAEAKRRIVDEHPPNLYDRRWCETCDTRGGGTYPCDTLRSLARPYADHPDYDPAWRPA